jgi:hypothetical protein
VSTQNTVITLEQLAQDFTSLFKWQVFRLETLDYYDAPNEREPYARFLAGEPVDPAWREPWKKLVREVRASGRVMQRVHVVSKPLSDYMRFSLLHGYPASVKAGEDVRIIARGELGEDNERADFWLFDGTLAAFLIYDDAGRVQRVELERDPYKLSGLVYLRHEALRYSQPLAAYVAEHDITERKHAA